MLCRPFQRESTLHRPLRWTAEHEFCQSLSGESFSQRRGVAAPLREACGGPGMLDGCVEVAPYEEQTPRQSLFDLGAKRGVIAGLGERLIEERDTGTNVAFEMV